MQAAIRTINAAGLAEIRAILAENHKLGGDHFTDSMIRAWAEEVEFQLAEGNGATFEIKSWDHVMGWTQEFHLTDAAIETQMVEIEEE